MKALKKLMLLLALLLVIGLLSMKISTTKSHYNAALNLSFDFVLPQDQAYLTIPPNLLTILEDSQGQMLSLQRPDQYNYHGPDLSPAAPYGEVLMSRDAGALFAYSVFQADDLTDDQMRTILTNFASAPSEDFTTERHGPIEITCPIKSPGNRVSTDDNLLDFTFFIKYNNLLYYFGVFPLENGEEASSFIPATVINSIEIDGHRLQCTFADEADWWPTAAYRYW